MTINQIKEKLYEQTYNESIIQSDLISFDEWIDMTQKLFTPGELKVFTKLDKEYEGKEGELQLLDDALESDISRKYLVYRCMDCVNNAFFKYFLGPNRTMQKIRIKNDAWAQYIGCVFSVLMSPTANPIKVFDYNKVASSKGDVLNKFKWYFDKYLKAECERFNKAETERKASQLDIDSKDINAYETNLYTDSFEDDYDDVEGYYLSFKDAVEDLKGERNSAKPSSTYSILKYMVQHDFNCDLKDIAPALGIASGQVSWKKNEIFNALSAHDIGARELQSLIVHHEYNRKIKQLFN